jgi:hypothetical protein
MATTYIGLDFNPTGLNYVSSLGASQSQTSGFRKANFPPNFYGWTGDLLCPFIGRANSTPLDSAFGFVYPAPLTLLQNDTAPTILGVIAGFEYYPLALNGTAGNPKYYMPNTPLMPSTNVQVIYSIDPEMEYTIQMFEPDGVPSNIIGQGLFTNSQFIYQYTTAPSGNNFNLSLGHEDPYDPNAGQSYIYGELLTLPPQPLPPQYITQPFAWPQNPLIVTGIAEGSQFTEDQIGQDPFVFQNPYVKVKISTNFFTQGSYNIWSNV